MPIKSSVGTWGLVGLQALCVVWMALAARRPEAWEGFVAAAFVAGLICWLVWRRGDVGMGAVIAVALVYRIALIWLPPVLSDDAFRYVWDGLLQAEGINPYQFVPEDPALAPFHHEPVFQELNSASYFSVYPPVSQLVFRVGALFYESGWEASYFVIKAIFAAMEFGAVLVLARLVSPAALILYAWNPLVLIAGAGQAHGEAVLALFLSLTLLAARRGMGSRAAVWLACAGWVKLYPFLLFPFLWRRFGWKSVAAGAAAAAVLAAPYVHVHAPANVLASLDLYVRLFEFNAGPYYAVKKVFLVVTGADWSKQIGPALRTIFLVAVPVLYYLDGRLGWSLRQAFVVTVGTFFVCATTVHPWYLVGILVLVAPVRPPSWHWQWLGLVSIGTYLLYAGGPYWTWVHLGWSGWLVLAVSRYRSVVLEWLMRRRARAKARLLVPLLHGKETILDIGAAEGYVAHALTSSTNAHVELVDVLDLNRTSLPHRLYDGRRLPYADRTFEAAILVYVLHHARDPRAVLREAARVTESRVVVLESTFRRDWERRVLAFVDRWANRVRSGGHMTAAEGHVQFRRAEEWRNLFRATRLRLIEQRNLRGFIHHPVLFVLEAESAQPRPIR